MRLAKCDRQNKVGKKGWQNWGWIKWCGKKWCGKKWCGEKWCGENWSGEKWGGKKVGWQKIVVAKWRVAKCSGFDISLTIKYAFVMVVICISGSGSNVSVVVIFSMSMNGRFHFISILHQCDTWLYEMQRSSQKIHSYIRGHTNRSWEISYIIQAKGGNSEEPSPCWIRVTTLMVLGVHKNPLVVYDFF